MYIAMGFSIATDINSCVSTKTQTYFCYHEDTNQIFE